MNIIKVLLIFSISSISAQIVEIPDPIFKDLLINHSVADYDDDGFPDSDADLNNDGEIQISEAEAVIGLHVRNNGITSLEGLEFFTNLIVLDCSGNELETINLSGNTFLRDLICMSNNITELDVSHNADLQLLACSHNDLLLLDVSNNPLLRLLGCSSNELRFLDTSSNLNLEQLGCSFNQIENLELSQNLHLQYLSCSFNQIETLELSANQQLTSLFCGYNFLTSLNLSGNPLLRNLDCRSNNISVLELQTNHELKWIRCQYNLIENIDVGLSENLELLLCYDNNLTTLDLSNNPLLEKLNCGNNLLSELNIKNGNNENLIFMNASNNVDLFCIQTDIQNPKNPWCDTLNEFGWCKDTWAEYNTDCLLGANNPSPLGAKIWPNPVKNTLNIKSELVFQSIKIYNLNGQLVLNTDENQIDISGFNSGVYFILMEHDDITYYTKVVKE